MNILTKFRQKLSIIAESLGQFYDGPRILQELIDKREMILIDSRAKPMGLGSDTRDFGIWCGFSTTQSFLNIADSNKDIPNWWSIEDGGTSAKFPGSSNLTVGPYHTVTMLKDYTYVDYDLNKLIVSPLWPFIILMDDGVIVPKLEKTDGEEKDSYFLDQDGVEFKHDVPEDFIIRDDYNIIDNIIMSLAVFDNTVDKINLQEIKKEW